MNSEVLQYVLIIAFSIFGIVSNSIKFNPVRFICDNYILNSYLYFILSWGIVLTTIATLNKKEITVQQLFTGPFTILLMLSSILLIVGLLFIPPEMFFTKHILFIFEIILLGLFLYPLYVKNEGLFKQVGFTTLIILIILSAITYFAPYLVKESWGTYLMFSLLALIVARCVELFMTYRNKERPSNYSRIISYVAVILFSFFIMYDTKKLIVNSQKCVRPDYINESLNLFLDSLNMFSSLYHIQDS